MRYSIMLQLVGLITLVLLTTAALFAWLQNRSVPSPSTGLNTGQCVLPHQLEPDE